MEYTIFEVETGAIVAHVEAQTEAAAAVSCAAGEAAISGKFDPVQFLIVDGVPQEKAPEPVPVITPAEALAAAVYRSAQIVRSRIGAVRKAYITDLPGQGMIYQAKEDEAAAYLALAVPPPDLSGFPYLEAEVGVTAPSAVDLAHLWLAMAASWRQVGADLEGLRLGTIAQLEAAADMAQVEVIMDGFMSAISVY